MLLILVVINIGLIGGTKQSVQAAASFEKATFMVAPVLPADNIGGKQRGYFNLKLAAKQQKTVQVRLMNPTPHPVVVHSRIVDATTNDNGTLDYIGTHQIDQKLLSTPGSQWVTVTKKVTLAPHEERLLPVTIKAPTRQFEGQKALAINLTANQINAKRAVKNQYTYALGLVLNGHQTSQKQRGSLKLAQIKTRLTPTKRQPAISVKINNPSPYYHLKTTLTMSLTNQRWSLIQYHKTRTKVKIAPNSGFYNDLLLGGKRLVPGVYRLKVTVNEGSRKYQMKHYVQISNQQARFINRHNYVYLKYRNLIIIGILLVILGIASLIYWWKGNKNAKTHS